VVGVLLDRSGVITHVMVGDARSLVLPDWGRLRAGRGRLRGLRCIHTRLGDEGLTQDDLTDLARLRLDAVVVVDVTANGLPGLAHVAALTLASDGSMVQRLAPAPPAQLDWDFQAWIRDLEESLARETPARDVAAQDSAILVSITTGRRRGEEDIHMAELVELARSAGVAVAGIVTQHLQRVDPKTLVGAGKLQTLALEALRHDVDLVIVDQNLTPTQARNLAERLELRVLDRTQLILDIFAQQATSKDGKLQVELAQLKYRLPRLAQRDTSLSRLAGGIGGRGPGETKLEVDRRRVRDRITRLERELGHLRQEREGRRQRRRRHGIPILSIVGYTNAGKSTLLRALTHTNTRVEDRMFATLDPASRRLRFPREREVIITDTVGFIRDLPPDLMAAFRATLEELEDAALLLHVVDAAAPDYARRIASVRHTLVELGLDVTPELLVFNQSDRLPAGAGAALAEREGGVAISALKSRGLPELLERIEEIMWREQPMSARLFATGGR